MSNRGPWSSAGTEMAEIGTYALLQAYIGPETAFYVRGVTNIFDGGAGVFRVDASDTTSADNGGTILVDAAGRRWKREFSGDVNALWFVGASADATAGVSAAHAYCATLTYGSTLYLPRGRYLVTALPSLVAGVNWAGDGRLATQVIYSGTGDGLKFGGTINTYTSLRISIRDLTIACSNAGNTGGGIVLESCSYVLLHNVYVEKFKYGQILDQVTHFWCSHSELAQQTRASVWVVNGNDRRASANQGWTNNLWFGPEIQINLSASAGIYGVQDDGGVNHQYNGVNFNGADILARIAGVQGLTFVNCAHESSLQAPLVLTNTTREGGDYVGPCRGFTIRDNTFSSAVAYEIDVQSGDGGVIETNGFGGMSAAAFLFGSADNVSNVSIRRNRKLITGSSRNAKPFFDAGLTTALLRSIDTSEQQGQSYVASSHAGGAQTVTPASMERLRIGDHVYCVNEDGTNGEHVLVTNTGATTFTATFASTKAANWLVYGQASERSEGAYSPEIIGTVTAGSNTYTVQTGNWSRIGNQVHVQGTITMSVKDGAMAGNLEISLPFRCVNTANRNNTATFGYYSGLTFPANFTQLAGLVTPNADRIALRRNGSGQTGAAVAVSEIAAGATLAFEATYYTH